MIDNVGYMYVLNILVSFDGIQKGGAGRVQAQQAELDLKKGEGMNKELPQNGINQW